MWILRKIEKSIKSINLKPLFQEEKSTHRRYRENILKESTTVEVPSINASADVDRTKY